LAKISIKDLLEGGVHFGHPTRRWNPKMRPYIYAARNGIYLFDLTITMHQLEKACQFLHDLVAGGGAILFVGTKRQAQDAVRETAQATGMHYMAERWLGGTLTNNVTIRKSISRLEKLREMEESGAIENLPKKEAAAMRRELAKLEANLSGITNMRKMPDAMVVIDIDREDIAVREANRLGIPVVALVDTNCDPDVVDHVIPGNDDALRAIAVIMEAFKHSLSSAREVWQKRIEEEARQRAEEEARRAREAEERTAARAKAKAEAAAAAEAEAADDEKPQPEGEPASEAAQPAPAEPQAPAAETPAAETPAAETPGGEESEAGPKG